MPATTLACEKSRVCHYMSPSILQLLRATRALVFTLDTLAPLPLGPFLSPIVTLVIAPRASAIRAQAHGFAAHLQAPPHRLPPRVCNQIPPTDNASRRIRPVTASAQNPDLSVKLGKVTLKNPVLTASGTCGYAHEYSQYVDLSKLGGFTTKSVTVKPRMGNAPQRIVETPGGMLNAIGLANVGLDEFMSKKLPEIATLGAAVFVNVAGHSIEDYVTVCRAVDAAPEIAGIELNVSCPNVADGLMFGTDPASLKELVAAVRPEVKRGTLIVKLSPNVTDISATARAAVEAGADALSMVNTFLGMVIDIEKQRPVLANQTGGLSGPAIRPMAVHLVHKVYREVAESAGVPIIGIGGISNWRDAVEFILAGASAVSVGTALYVDPTTPIQIVEGLSDYLSRHGLASVGELVGAAHRDKSKPPASPQSGAEG